MKYVHIYTVLYNITYLFQTFGPYKSMNEHNIKIKISKIKQV